MINDDITSDWMIFFDNSDFLTHKVMQIMTLCFVLTTENTVSVNKLLWCLYDLN